MAWLGALFLLPTARKLPVFDGKLLIQMFYGQQVDFVFDDLLSITLWQDDSDEDTVAG